MRYVGILLTFAIAALIATLTTIVMFVESPEQNKPIPVVLIDSPLFTAGETIGAVTDCFPQGFVPPSVFACYAEVLTILKVRSDGWLETQDERGNLWMINADRIYGFQRSPRGQVPVEPLPPAPPASNPETTPLIRHA